MATGGYGHSSGSESNDDAVGGRVSTTCNPCDRNNKSTPATLRCTPCNERLCDECCKIHKIYTPGNHEFVDLHDPANKRTLVDMKGFDKCAEHGHFVLYQCLSHGGVLCCEDCHFFSHKRCENLTKISQLAECHDLTNNALEEKAILACITTAKDIATDSDSNMNTSATNDICGEITRVKNEVMKLFDDTRIRIQQELANINSEENARLNRRKTTALDMKSELENVHSVNKEVQTNGNNIEKCTMRLVSKNKLTRVEADLCDMLRNDYTLQRKIKWDDRVLNLLQQKELKVTLNVHREPRYSEGIANGAVSIVIQMFTL